MIMNFVVTVILPIVMGIVLIALAALIVSCVYYAITGNDLWK